MLLLTRYIKQSPRFKFLVYATLFLFTLVIVLLILQATVKCTHVKHYQHCTSVPMTTYGYQCKIGQVTYCCNYFDFDQCGDTWCRALDLSDQYTQVDCQGLKVALWVFIGVFLLSMLVTTAIFCFYKSKPMKGITTSDLYQVHMEEKSNQSTEIRDQVANNKNKSQKKDSALNNLNQGS